MVLMDLLSVKTPITDADSIRALACKALLGLARSENARQIMGKLPLFTSGQLQVNHTSSSFVNCFSLKSY
jgi:HIV-1 Vpr-binding protein